MHRAPGEALPDSRERIYSASVLRVVSWSFLALATLFLGARILDQPMERPLALGTLAGIYLVCGASLWLTHLGRTQLASRILIAGLLLRGVLSALETGGVGSPGADSFPFCVLLAALLLGSTAAILTALGCSVLGLGLVAAERAGLLQQPVYYSAWTNWFINAFYLGLVVWVARLNDQSVQNALDRAEGELEERRAAEGRLRQALEAGKIAVWEYDRAAATFRGDERGFELLGLPVSADRSLSLAAWAARVHRADLPRLRSALESLGPEHRRIETSFRIRRADGTDRHLEAAADFVAESGASGCITGMLRDVTEVRAAESERNRLVYNYAERIKELTALREASSLLREEALEIPRLLQRLAELLPPALQYPEIAQARVCYGSIVGATAGFRVSEWTLTQRFSVEAGNNGWIDVAYLEPRPDSGLGPFFVEEQLLLEALARMLRTALERRAAQAALAASEERYRGIVEMAEEAILLLDPDGIMQFANPKLCTLTSYGQAELVGQFGGLLLFPEDVPVIIARRDERRRTGEVQHFDLRLRHREGHAVPVFVSATAIRDAEKGFVGTMAMMTDMSLRDRLQAELLQAQKIDALGRLSGGVAHDFNNMLSAILGFAELVKATLPRGDGRHEDMDALIGTAERAAGLTRQLLAFSRKQTMQPVALDFSEVVRELDKMLSRVVPENIRITLELEPGLSRCRADKVQMEQVLLNLVVNARDAMPSGGALRIRTSTQELGPVEAADRKVAAGRYVCVAVEDTGSGMSEETLRHIYEPFFTTKPKGQGTGLGLSTVHGIVTQSGGFLRVRSTPGRGSTFEACFPVTTAADTPAPAEPARRYTLGGNETLLLVDDDQAVRLVARRHLSSAGYRVLEAETSQSALEILNTERGKIDLLITDVVMPDLGGLDLAARASEGRPSLRVLCISGYHDRDLPDPPPNLRITHLAKPFTSALLTAKVREVLDANG